MEKQEQVINEVTRLRVLAFVCPNCEVLDPRPWDMPADVGYVMFYKAYTMNPKSCRYLVAERGTGDYLVIDLWDDEIIRWASQAPLIIKLSVDTYMRFPTKEGAFMAAAMLPQSN